MSQPLCFDIKYWGRYRPFLSKQSQLIKIKSHHCCVTLLNAICYIVQKTKPMTPLSTAPSNSHFHYSYASMYSQQLEYFVVEIHHGDILYFPTSLINSKNSKKQLSRSTPCCEQKDNFGLRVCRIFSCVPIEKMLIKIKAQSSVVNLRVFVKSEFLWSPFIVLCTILGIDCT